MSDTPKQPEVADRLAKVIARAGLCSRRDAEGWISDGRVSVNGKKVLTPAFNVTSRDKIEVDGLPLAARQGTRVWLYHKPAGLVVTEKDPEGRPTIFEALEQKGLPRVLTVGRLDINTEGLLLLTNDGGLKRVLELPATGWLRRYRVRAHGTVSQAQLDRLKEGIEVEGVKYGPIQATLEREQGSNVWLLLGLREGKNREVKNVLGALGLEVNRLIRISYGPFQLGDLPEGGVEMVKSRLLRDQLGKKLSEQAGADFESEMPDTPPPRDGRPVRSPRDRDTGFARRPAPVEGRGDRPGPRGGDRFDQRDARPDRGSRNREDGLPVRARRVHFDEDGRAPEVFTEKPQGRGRGAEPARGAPPRGARTDHQESRGSFGDRPPRRDGGKPARGGFGDRPERSFGDKPARGARPERGFADRPKRSFGDKPARGARPERSFEDRPKRDFGDRPKRGFGDAAARGPRPDRGADERPKRGGKPADTRKPFARRDGDAPRGARPEGGKSFGKPFAKPGGPRPQGARPTGARPTGGRPTAGRPAGARPTGSRPTGARPTGGRPTGGRPPSGRPAGPRKPRNDR
ncbi:pseudouridine synthase [Devosia sp. PTR5]|uniref:Pseudouridine synthase n=1 Tax=Devosia oryzisoli TaxID=2774138 RepID=A0A927FVG1_9HYPH|nr:pseudouridine synthase [Devosia oryzisoli]MBD8065558.1 pseudouridine synthase [Devosia oryzisoli]